MFFPTLTNTSTLDATHQALFLLSDNDLRPLGSLEKTNPQHKAWTAMRMYMKSQVRILVL